MVSIVTCHFMQSLGNHWAWVFNIGVQVFLLMSGFLYGYMRYKVHVKDSKNLPFSAVADIPGVFFKRDGYDWSMECHNPYVEVNL